MQNPEVWTFQEPQSSFLVKKIIGSSDFPVKNLSSFYFNHLVSVVLPDSLRAPQNLVDVLSNDCEYYKILDLNLSDLLDTTFLTNFIKQGNLTLLSIGTRIDCDNCVAVTPTGFLILSLTKDTYQTLGLEGNTSHFTKKNKDRYSLLWTARMFAVVKINLKESKLQPGKANYEKTKNALASLERITVVLSWKPPDESICPSSIAKFFNDLKYNVKVCEPKFNTHVVYSVKTPTLEDDKFNENDIEDFVEWLGMVSVEGDFTEDVDNYISSYDVPEPNVEVGQVRCLQWRGFYQPDQIVQLINFLKNYCSNGEKFWIAVYVQGFSDAPVIDNNEENHYFTNSDNANLFILNKSRFFWCKHRCCAKRYK